MIYRLLLLFALSAVMFSSGTYTGWRAARWLDPVLDTRDRSAEVSRRVRSWFNE